jgi:hypothetical protein
MDAVQGKADTTTNTLVTARREEREERRERRERDRCSDAMKSIFHPSYPLLIRSLPTHVNSISSMDLSLRLDFIFLFFYWLKKTSGTNLAEKLV